MVLEKDDEYINKEIWTLVFDGASNALGHRVLVVLISLKNQFILFIARLCIDYTNNTIEYEAGTMDLEAAIDLKVKVLEVYGDSALFIHQVKGE